MIRAGEFRHRVTYQEKPTTPDLDTYGQDTAAWADVFACWGRVRPLAGRELEVARQRRADASHAIDVRGPRTIKPAGRFQWLDNNGVTHTGNVTEPPRDIDGDSSHLSVIVSEVPTQG